MQHILKNLGLDDTEAKVYLALLELGPSTVTEVTSTADITRTLGYHVLEKLEHYKLIKSVSKSVPRLPVRSGAKAGGTSSKKRYFAEHPDKLIQFVQDRKTTWERKLEEAEKQLPNLLSLYKIADKPTLKCEEGLEAAQSVSRGTLLSVTPIVSIINIDAKKDLALTEVIVNTEKEIRNREIEKRSIILEDNSWIKEAGIEDLKSYRKISKEKLPGLSDLSGELTIYENKISIISPTEFDYIAATFESEMLAVVLKGMFELAWEIGSLQ